MICGPPRQQRGVAEFGVADQHQQRLRQVEVDVRIHAQQHVPQRRQGATRVVCRGERGSPRAAHGLAPQAGLQRLHVEPSEHHIPTAYPDRVEEPTCRKLGVHSADRVHLIRHAAGLLGTGEIADDHARRPECEVVHTGGTCRGSRVQHDPVPVVEEGLGGCPAEPVGRSGDENARHTTLILPCRACSWRGLAGAARDIGGFSLCFVQSRRLAGWPGALQAVLVPRQRLSFARHAAAAGPSPGTGTVPPAS
jgi:hypothetical protein